MHSISSNVWWALKDTNNSNCYIKYNVLESFKESLWVKAKTVSVSLLRKRNVESIERTIRLALSVSFSSSQLSATLLYKPELIWLCFIRNLSIIQCLNETKISISNIKSQSMTKTANRWYLTFNFNERTFLVRSYIYATCVMWG